MQFSDNSEVVVVGAGIVGLAVARAILDARPAASVTVVDKEPEVGAHQSGHNSGVLHSGLYYRPGSLKAQLCVSGRAELEVYCAARAIPFERCGKVVVATTPAEVPRLLDLRDRGVANGLAVELLDRHGLHEHEPHADGLLALFVPATGVVDFGQVTTSLAGEVMDRGATLRLGSAVTAFDEDADGVTVRTTDGLLRAHRVVNCGGLQSDLLARAGGIEPRLRIVPFRGEFLSLKQTRAHLVRHLIYPVPDPRFPFLGAHFTRGIDGTVHAGPNAVLALAREGYSWGRVSWEHVRALATDPALWRLAERYWRTGLGEVTRSLNRRSMVRALQRLVPDVRLDDLEPAGAGVRAQAVRPDGTLVDDFAIERTDRVVHVLNAPSPAATSSLAIGRWIVQAMDAPVPTAS